MHLGLSHDPWGPGALEPGMYLRSGYVLERFTCTLEVVFIFQIFVV